MLNYIIYTQWSWCCIWNTVFGVGPSVREGVANWSESNEGHCHGWGWEQVRRGWGNQLCVLVRRKDWGELNCSPLFPKAGLERRRSQGFFRGAQQDSERQWPKAAASVVPAGHKAKNSSWGGWLSTGGGCPWSGETSAFGGASELGWKRPWATWSNFEDTCPTCMREHSEVPFSIIWAVISMMVVWTHVYPVWRVNSVSSRINGGTTWATNALCPMLVAELNHLT